MNKTKLLLLKEKTDNPLAILTKKRKRIFKIRNERGDIKTYHGNTKDHETTLNNYIPTNWTT